MIFVDTSFWAALTNRRDGRHPAAAERLRRSADQELVTTNWVRAESWTLLRVRAGHAAAVRFLDQLQRSPRLTLVSVGDDVEGEAIAWLRRHDERPYSFVDATSFAVMRSMRIRTALAFDDDFVAAGFTLVEG